MVPSIFHFWYFFYDFGKEVILDNNKKEWIIKRWSREIARFRFEDLSHIQYYRRCNFAEDNISSLGIENYFFIDFIMKDDTSHRVTCLLIPKIRNLPFKVVFFKKWFPLPIN